MVEQGSDVRRRRGRDQKETVIAAANPAEHVRESSRKGFLFRRTVGAFGLEIPVSAKALMLDEEERTLSILRHIEKTVPVETKWWPVFHRYVDLYTGRVAGLGGDPTQVNPTGDGNWKGADDSYHDHDCDPDHDCGGHGRHPHWDDEIIGKVVSVGYDHFGDFTGFVVETERGNRAAVRSTETRIERLAREAWTARALVRVRLRPDHEVASLQMTGHIDE